MNAKFRAQNKKVLLLLDNAPVHKISPSGYSHLDIEFLPPKTTSEIQPLDAGIISSYKRRYRAALVARQLRAVEAMKEFQFTLLDAILLSATAWNEVTASTIQNCWRHAGLYDGDSDCEIEEEDDSGGMVNDDYVNFDENVSKFTS